MKKILALMIAVAGVAYVASTQYLFKQPLLDPETIVLIILDTSGAKHVLGPDHSAPFLSKLADDSVNFTHAYSTSSWTKPSIASVFTGRLPAAHGVQHPRSRLSEQTITIAEYFSRQGYQTAGFVSHTFLSPKTDYKRGFETYQLVDFTGHVHDSVTSDQVTSRGLEWLASKVADTGETKKKFLFLHYFDPHTNYKHHADFDLTSWYQGELSDKLQFSAIAAKAPNFSSEDMRYVQGLYHEEINYTDHQIKRFYEGIKQLGIDKKALIIVTADHGEAFMEHGRMGHGWRLYNELVRVPLIVHSPNMLPHHLVSQPVSTMDIFPSVLELLGIEHEVPRTDGISFAPLLGGTSSSNDARKPLFELEYHSQKVGMVSWPWKIIFDKKTKTWELFDLEQDPSESKNVFEVAGEQVIEERKVIEAYAASEGDKDAELPLIEYSEDEIKKLKSLGYLM